MGGKAFHQELRIFVHSHPSQLETMTYDRSVKMFDEPHAPEKLDAMVQSKTINKGKFATRQYGDSYLLQMQTIRGLKGVKSVFEVGPGEAFAAKNLSGIGYTYHTFDFESAHNPTYVGDFSKLDVSTIPQRYDVTCAFQVLEHFPYEQFTTHMKRLRDLSQKYVFISIPYSCRGIGIKVNFQNGQSKRKNRNLDLYWGTGLPNRKYRPEYMEEFPWGVHFWEIGRKGFKKKKVLADVESCGLKVMYTFHSPNPYHFFILAKVV